MNDNEIIQTLGGTTKVAKLCGVTLAAVSQWRNNGIPKDKLICLAISLEKASEGKITRKELFPDTWKQIWGNIR
jgi:DNA-binding transcriptional regulator YdaS (Cro superfamily)